MKLKIKVKTFGSIILPNIISKGDWIDLSAKETISYKGPHSETLKQVNNEKIREVVFDARMIPLGVAMKLPKGFEAIVLPRSSTFKNRGIIMANSQGVIDNSYCGNNDEWKFPMIAFRDGVIEEGSRIAQFRIQLSQKASMWSKLKWLFSSGIELVKVKELDSKDRGGFGSTDI